MPNRIRWRRLARVSTPPIDPSTLPGQQIYLSGLAGVNQTGGVLTSWVDQKSSISFAPLAGSTSIAVLNSGTGLKSGVSVASVCGGNFYRAFGNLSLGSYSAASGLTQHLLTGGVGAGTYGDFVLRWPAGAAPSNFVFQAPGFDGGGGTFWAGHPVAAGNIALVAGSALDTGVATSASQFTWDLWTLVHDGVAATSLYRNGRFVVSLATGALQFGSQLTFGGPSTGSAFVCVLITGYQLFTALQTPAQIAGVHSWYRSVYGST